MFRPLLGYLTKHRLPQIVSQVSVDLPQIVAGEKTATIRWCQKFPILSSLKSPPPLLFSHLSPHLQTRVVHGGSPVDCRLQRPSQVRHSLSLAPHPSPPSPLPHVLFLRRSEPVASVAAAFQIPFRVAATLFFLLLQSRIQAQGAVRVEGKR